MTVQSDFASDATYPSRLLPTRSRAGFLTDGLSPPYGHFVRATDRGNPCIPSGIFMGNNGVPIEGAKRKRRVATVAQSGAGRGSVEELVHGSKMS
jgi:hypothetical protein